ncbi:MAG TPA: hypothetical protein VF902_09530, partial [Coriobacteriia bacterium]
VLADGSPGAGRDGVVEARPGGTAVWVQVASVRTEATGSFAAPVYPTGTTEYRARWFPVPGADALSSTSTVGFGSTTTIKASASAVRRGRYVTLSGAVTPNHAGRTVSIHYRYGARGRYRTLSVRTLSAAGAYSVRMRVGSRGYYYFHAHFAGDPSHRGSDSGTVRVRGY